MWEQIRANRIRSFWVVSLLGGLLVGVGGATGLMFGGEASVFAGAAIALIVWLVLWLVSRAKGDNILLSIAGAKQVKGSQLPQLRNVVEEMSIAAGLNSVPQIYVVDDPTPNAFAVGRNPDKAAVAVTTGLLGILNRDELQGVVAHEIGHIKNRDVALMSTAGIMLGAIVLLGDVAMRGLWYGGSRRSRSSSEQGNGAVLVLGLVLLILAPILAQLLYFSLSRRREYLADASGARFTRYPEGLASALEKLGGGGSKPQADQSKVTAPMYFVRPMAARSTGRRRSNSWFSTHPPLADRIRILRGMGGGAGLADYDQAYKSVHGKGVIGGRSLVGDSGDESAIASPPSAAADVAPAGVSVATTNVGVAPSHVGDAKPPVIEAPAWVKTRQASDAYLTASGYSKIECRNCSAVLKVPPQLSGKLKSCPRCGSGLQS